MFWIVSYPKSGNTWMRAIVSSLFYSEEGFFNFELFKSIPNFEKKENYYFIRKFNKNDFNNISDLKIISKYRLEAQKKANIINGDFAFFKTHSANIDVDNFKYTSNETTLGVIYLTRDPRDIVLSLSHHKGSTIDEIIKLMIDEGAIYNVQFPNILSSWNHHYRSWLNLNVPKLIIKYEDLSKNTEKVLWNIVNFFQKNYKLEFKNIEKKISNILQSTNFDTLQEYEKKFGFNEARNGFFFRKGKINQWRKELSQKEINIIEEAFKDVMNELGYL